MASAGHKFVEQTTRQTKTGDTDWSDVTGAQILAADLTAGKDYLLIVSCLMDISAVTVSGGVRVTHGATPTVFADSELIEEPRELTTRFTYMWWTRWTAVSGEDIDMQFKTTDSGQTVGADTITMVAINIDDLPANSFFSNFNTTSTVLSTSPSSSNNAAITFTPGTASQKWLIGTTARIDSNLNTVSYESQIVRSGEASSTDVTPHTEGADVIDFLVKSNFWGYTLGAASNTFTEKSLSVNGTSGDRTHSGVFAWNISAMADGDFAAAAAGIDLVDTQTDPWGTEVHTLDITPDTQADFLIVGQWVHNCFSVPRYAKSRLQVDNADQPADQTADLWERENSHDGTDELPIQFMTVENLTAALHSIDIDGSTEDGAEANKAEDRFICAISMELPGGIIPQIMHHRKQMGMS